MSNKTLDNKTCHLNFSVTIGLSDKSREYCFPSKNSAEVRCHLFSKRSIVAEKSRIGR